MGLSGEWIEIDDLLPESSRHMLLRFSISSSSNVFDPGRIGSYFKIPERVLESLRLCVNLKYHPLKHSKNYWKNALSKV